jgi:hypothetical protein
MRRWIGIAVGVAAVAAVVAGATGALASTSGPTAAPLAAAAPTCSGTVGISVIGWNPPTVTRGGSSTVSATLQNCTAQAVTTQVMWLAMYGSPPGTGIPAGCVAIDPLPGSLLTVPANGTATTSMGFFTLASCTATGLQATVRVNISGNPTIIATASATLNIIGATTTTTTSPPPATCAVSYVKASEWVGGFVANVTISNTGTTAINGWTLVFTYPGDQHVSSGWNGNIVQNGQTVTVTNLSYNALINPGQSTSFGLQGTWHTSDASPTVFTLNGKTCTTK